ncbi:hypothetical protein J2W49_001888 [Hydrogenophaga palleronii]|uniref:Uncharacterized protein n=1 Tax=Hydrogenophaga palleronii TaxID=65655 RepID=A0ABU1WL18_9BURK|nr:hypothetical protein [Hydrogenophaga palleronii]MDR7149933.1 hypothetical protein [Hydrogenophaga palleronii]
MNMAVNGPGTPGSIIPTSANPAPAKPADLMPSAAPAAPQGVQTRNSASADMPPRQSLIAQFGLPPQPAPQGPQGSGGPPGRPGPDLSAVNKQGGDDATSKAKTEADQSMKTMAEMNAINMRFQTEMGIMQMQKGMNEAVAKMVKDIGTKAAQLAG